MELEHWPLKVPDAELPQPPAPAATLDMTQGPTCEGASFVMC